MNRNPRHVHFVGIGGIGMSALARVLLDDGFTVSGSDAHWSPMLDKLAAAGATVFVGHRAEQLGAADMVIVTAAVRDDNPEIRAALNAGIPVIKRAELLGRLMNARRGVAVAGTHGKTTTSAMIGHIVLQAGLDPTLLIGGELIGLESNARFGRGPWLVAEADEYDASFLQLRPEVAVVTNVEADHLEFYGSLANIHHAFETFAGAVRSCLVLCVDDPFVMDLAGRYAKPDVTVVTYGLAQVADWRARDIRTAENGGSEFTLQVHGQAVTVARLQLSGRHNVANAVGAMVAAAACGVPAGEAAAALASFAGVHRRLERKGAARGVTVYDDYGHHPTEIRATLAALRARYPHARLVCLFQPHTFSRTKLLLDDFATCFGDADVLRVADIYASRETDSLGISAMDLVRAAKHPDVKSVGGVENAAGVIAELRPGDVVLTIGAGDIYRTGEMLLKALEG